MRFGVYRIHKISKYYISDIQKQKELSEQVVRLNKNIDDLKSELETSNKLIGKQKEQISKLEKETLDLASAAADERRKLEEHWKQEVKSLENKHEDDNGELFHQFEEDQVKNILFLVVGGIRENKNSIA